MNKVYSRIIWKNYPNTSTAINETNLNRMDKAIDDLDNRVIEQDSTKANQTTVNNMVKNWTMDETTGVITVEKQDGSKIMFDLNIEKIPVTFELSPSGILTMTTSDGTQFTANIGSMIPVLTFNESDQIAVSVSGSGVNKTYSFTVKDGSITESKLQPNYLADIKSESAKATTAAELAKEKSDLATESENNAKQYKESAESSAKLSKSYAIGGTNSRENEDIDNSKYYSQQSLNSSDSAKKSELAASTSESNAKSSETEAKKSEENAKLSEQSASNSSSSAAESKSNALQSANNALVSETNSKKYYDQVKNISESLSGALRPMGTVLFSNLPSVSSVTDGDMYNISDEFVTTSDFVEGAGITEPAGSNVYKTSGGKWDVLAGSPVTGIKGSSESSYRRGNVEITPSNIGLGNVDNTPDSNKSVKYAKNAGSADSATKVNGHTVNSDVPANAKFTDNDTWIALKGANTSSAGTAGYAPAPSAGESNRYLRSDGTWSVPPDTWRPVVDNLTSQDADKSLSANQGKVLQEKIDTINSNLSNAIGGGFLEFGTINAGGSSEKIVTYSEKFIQSPSVVATINHQYTDLLKVSVYNITKTQCTVRVFNTGSIACNNVVANWIAICFSMV
jgi:hypothetical protein